jgi:hypothetical protein
MGGGDLSIRLLTLIFVLIYDSDIFTDLEKSARNMGLAINQEKTVERIQHCIRILQ